MSHTGPIYIIGTGAVGLPLAAFLAHEGRSVVAVRARDSSSAPGTRAVTVRGRAGDPLVVQVGVVPLAGLHSIEGLVVIATKAHANLAIVERLRALRHTGPLVLLQNGLGIEEPFLAGGTSDVYRGVLYLTSQESAPHDFTFRAITSCPVGVVRGSPAGLAEHVARLSTPHLQFHAEPGIDRAVWKKAIVNAVFNSICPLLDIDNGVFVRESSVAALAQEVVCECLTLARTRGVALTESELMDQIMQISRNSGGVLISTLQDIRRGRETEIESLNIAMARLAATSTPAVELSRTELLGRLILAKSRMRVASKLGVPCA